MRLTLRTLLAYRHGLLGAGDAEAIASRLAASDNAQQLYARLQQLGAQPADRALPTDAASAIDPNTLAEYLDHVLAPEAVAEVERQCLARDDALAEVIAAHDVLVLVQSEPVSDVESLRRAAHALSGRIEPARWRLPVASTCLPVVREAATPDENPFDKMRRLTASQLTSSWLVSCVAHQLAVLLLALWLLPHPTPPASLQLLARIAEDEPVLPVPGPQNIISRDEDPVVAAPPAPANEAVAPTKAAVSLPRIETVALRSETRAPPVVRGAPPEKKSTAAAPNPGRSARVGTNAFPHRERSKPSEGGVVATTAVHAAVDGVLDAIRKELDSGDLLVVWLLDASLSLVDDRQQVAARLEPFYREIDRRAEPSHLLMNAVVAYGNTSVELVAPTRFGLKTIEAVAQVPIDQTGLENVMTAVERCVAKYRKRWSGGMRVVVWTDESGDDTLRLEDTIALCRREGVAVSVVGPSSVFGSERGLHLYVDRATGYRFLLPVKRGPDTSYPERVVLPYWHDSQVEAWSRGGAQLADDVPWYGGPYREGVSSGVGPYALTRLALETGGMFTLLDRPEMAGPFDFETMRHYLPDYSSAAEYLHALKYSALRQAVFDVVQLTGREQQKFIIPKFSFIAQRSKDYPFRVRHEYLTPTEFRAELRDELHGQLARLRLGAAVLEAALARFGEQGMEAEYEAEKSLRWRAWYDLTRGRALAMCIRHREYALLCQALVQDGSPLAAETNRLTMRPSSQLRSNDSVTLHFVAEAKRLLERCVAQNPGTPWASLAQWELDHPLGLAPEQGVIPPPQPRPATPVGPAGPASGPAPVPALPNL